MSRQGALAGLAVICLTVAAGLTGLSAQTTPSNGNNNELVRRAKTKVEPFYPELARRMNIVGTVKIEVVVAPNGVVKEAKVVGGHPVLVNAALDAAKKWRFEPAPAESSGVIDFRFEPR